MHGNVWEWCLDRWHDNYVAETTDYKPWLDSDVNQTDINKDDSFADRVLRGGSWHARPGNCRSAFRSQYRTGFIYGSSVGLRVVCRPHRRSSNAARKPAG